MPLRESDYDKNFVEVKRETTIGTAFRKLADVGGRDDWHFFVVQADGSIGAVKVSALKAELVMVGGALFELSFAQVLPNPPIARVGPQNAIGIGTAESWALASEAGVLAVMNEDRLVGRLDTSGRRGDSEAFPDSTMSMLYGDYINTHPDERSRWRPSTVDAPACPKCGYQDFFGFDAEKLTYYCRNCSHIIKKGV